MYVTKRIRYWCYSVSSVNCPFLRSVTGHLLGSAFCSWKSKSNNWPLRTFLSIYRLSSFNKTYKEDRTFVCRWHWLHSNAADNSRPARLLESHRLNMEVELQSLFGLHVTWCALLCSLAETPQLPPSPRIWTRITRTLLVSEDRRHLFVTPCGLSSDPCSLCPQRLMARVLKLPGVLSNVLPS